jgi:predicted Zn finger-like uncharacterized protein
MDTVVVGCPKCKTRLNVPDEKIKPGGSKFRCPKCSTMLLVKRPERKPAVRPERIDFKKAIVAHERPETVERIKNILSNAGYMVSTASDGVSAMVKAMKSRPAIALLDIALPRIHGLEVSRRLKGRDETMDLKTLLVSSKDEAIRRVREPVSPDAVDEYIYEDELEQKLLETVEEVLKGKEEPQAQPDAAPPPEMKPVETTPGGETTAPVTEEDPGVARARRLARTILDDIDLYSPDKVNKAIEEGSFETVFTEMLNEGLKLYQKRISEEIKNRGDFFKEAVTEFIENKKRSLGL